MLRILIAGVLGGLAMYVWSALAHVATPLGSMGMSTIADEPAVTAALQTSLGDKAGLYMFPAAAMEGGTASGPSGLVVYSPTANAMTPATLASEAVVEILEGVIAALLLSFCFLTGYWARVGFVTLVGLAAVMATNPSYWIWYRFPADFTFAAMLMDLVGYVVAGLVIAAVLRRGRPA